MNDIIWKFDILIDDSFVNFNPNRVNKQVQYYE